MKLYGRDKELFEAQEQRETLSLARAAALREALEAIQARRVERFVGEYDDELAALVRGRNAAVSDCAAAVLRLLEKDDA